jgi:hypothetical protein
MGVLGHGEIGVTMNTYAHVLPQLWQEAADAIDELFGAWEFCGTAGDGAYPGL